MEMRSLNARPARAGEIVRKVDIAVSTRVVVRDESEERLVGQCVECKVAHVRRLFTQR